MRNAEISKARKVQTWRRRGLVLVFSLFLPVLFVGRSVPQTTVLVVQTGHSERVNSVAFSPGGKTLASGSDDKTVKLWDLPTSLELRTLKGHSGSVLSVAFSPDGQSLASGSQDGMIKLWSVATGKVLRTLKGHDRSAEVSSVAFSPDGKMLASASTDRSIKLWHISTGKVLHTLYAQYDAGGKELHTLYEASVFRSVAFSPDGKTLASGSDTVRLWSVATGKELRPRSVHVDLRAVDSVAFSPDGKILASGSSGFDDMTGNRRGNATVKLWDASTGRELRTFTARSDSVQSVVFSPDGKTLASGSGDPVTDKGTVTLWDVSTGTELRTLKGRTDLRAIRSVAFCPDGKTLASASGDKAVRLWNASTGTESRSLAGQAGFGAVTSVVMNPDGRTIANVSYDLETGISSVKLWDISTDTTLRTLTNQPYSTTPLAFSPDGKALAVGGQDVLVRFWDVPAGTGSRTIKLQAAFKSVTTIAFSPDGKTLATGDLDGPVKLWDLRTGAELLTLQTDRVDSVAFSPDGKTIAGGGYFTVRLWDVTTGRVLQTLKKHPATVNTIAYSPDGKTLASGTQYAMPGGGTSGGIDIGDMTPQPPVVKLWDVSTGRELRTLTGFAALTSVTSVAFSPDGKVLAGGSDDNLIRLWRVSTGKLLRILDGHSSSVTSVAFSTNNKYLVSGSWDGTIRIWEFDTGTEIVSLIALNDNDWVVVTPDGRFDTNKSLDNIEGLHWVVSGDPLTPLPLEIFMRQYYEPNLLQRLMKCTADNTCDKEFKPLPPIGQINRVQPRVQKPRALATRGM